MKPKIKASRENKTGRNTHFLVNGVEITRSQTVKFIKSNPNSGYHIRVVNGVETPASNPDNNTCNNIE